MNPLISIIIPTFNRAHLINETLNSIQKQTYINWECIIVDDGSNDDTINVVNYFLKKDARFKFYNRPKNRMKGPNSCRNYGFSKANGDIIQWFDSDDLLKKNAFELYIKEFEKNPKTDVVVSKLQMIEMDSDLFIEENRIQSVNIIEDYFTGKIAFYVCGPLWKRDFLLKRDELFNENITNLDDWDFNLRMLYVKPEIIFLNLPLIKYRVHENSLSQEIGKLNFNEIKSEMQAREKHEILIRQNKMVNGKVLSKFIIDRYKYFFREAMVQKNKHRFFYLKKLLIKELEILNFQGVIKTLFGFVVFLLFNKGYKLLK